jgi:glycerol-3-phosphate O-acyltransferase
MTSTVALPLWVVVLAVALALIAILDRILVPSVRWALRHRANRTIEELNTRLKLKIQPFKLAKRKVLIDRLLYDPEVLAAVEAHAQSAGLPRDVAMQKAESYAREIVPAFNAYTYFKVGTRLARRVSQALYRVRLGYADDAGLKAVDPDAAVVFVINHRSNMDYVLVTYVASSASALSYAVGEWAQVWLLRSLIRSMGAYFVRRDSRDPLYRRILSRYVAMATSAGVTQAVFPEGGLSRDGLLKPPKLGLLGYMIAGFDPRGARDVVFIPVGVNYDRVLEDRVLTGALGREGGKGPVFRFSPMILAGFLLKNSWLALRGRWFRYGYACVSFGRPLSLRDYLWRRGLDLRTLGEEARHVEIERLGRLLIDEVGRVVPALPVPVVATVMLAAGDETLTPFELKGRVFEVMRALEGHGAHMHIPRSDREYAIEVGLRMLVLRRLVEETAGGYRVNPAERTLLAYYANSIAHQLHGGEAAGPAERISTGADQRPPVGAAAAPHL